MDTKIQKTDEEWRRELTPEQYKVLRQKGTERPFTGEYTTTMEDGIYRCGACGEELFTSDSKFTSSCGWPSFTAPAAKDSVAYHKDGTFGMRRTEVTCTNCGSHLGHVFDDGPGPSGQRYCINSVSLKFDKSNND